MEGKLADIGQDAHTLAIVTYALALVNSARANDANTQLKAMSIDNAGKLISFSNELNDKHYLRVGQKVEFI